LNPIVDPVGAPEKVSHLLRDLTYKNALYCVQRGMTVLLARSQAFMATKNQGASKVTTFLQTKRTKNFVLYTDVFKNSCCFFALPSPFEESYY
jgi:hypothetical protein